LEACQLDLVRHISYLHGVKKFGTRIADYSMSESRPKPASHSGTIREAD
jgi:hypothetical protein